MVDISTLMNWELVGTGAALLCSQMQSQMHLPLSDCLSVWLCFTHCLQLPRCCLASLIGQDTQTAVCLVNMDQWREKKRKRENWTLHCTDTVSFLLARFFFLSPVPDLQSWPAFLSFQPTSQQPSHRFDMINRSQSIELLLLFWLGLLESVWVCALALASCNLFYLLILFHPSAHPHFFACIRSSISSSRHHLPLSSSFNLQ